jgi:hypothetical protein
LPGKVEKIIPAAPHVEESEKDHMSVDGADHLYRDIWVENILKNEHGEKVRLKEGNHVDVTIQVDPETTLPPI